jgi:predicted nucleic acid-binding protein
MKKPSNGGRAARVEKRAVKVMGKAQKTWTKAEAVRNTGKSSKNLTTGEFSNAEMKADRLYSKASRQATRATKLKEKSEFIKAKNAKPVPGMVGKTVKKGK